MFDDKSNELVTEVLAKVEGEVLDPGINFRSLDPLWEDEGWERGLLELNHKFVSQRTRREKRNDIHSTCLEST